MSYFKSHWFDILVSLISIGLCVYSFCIGNIDTGIIWLISASTWMGMSRVEYNDERIQLLEEKLEKNDALVKALQESQETIYQKFKELEGK